MVEERSGGLHEYIKRGNYNVESMTVIKNQGLNE